MCNFFFFVVVFIKMYVYFSLSDSLRIFLHDCAAKNLAYADQLAKENRERYKKDCLDGGMVLVDVDREAFRDALTDFYKQQFETKWNVSTYDEVMSYAK